MATKTKVLQGHTTNIDRTVNAWAEREGAVVKNVTLSPQGYMGKAGWVTATIVYEEGVATSLRDATPQQIESGTETLIGCGIFLLVIGALIWGVVYIATT